MTKSCRMNEYLARTYMESHELFEFMHLNINIVKHLWAVYATNNIILQEMHAFVTPRLPSMQLYFPNMKFFLKNGNFYSFSIFFSKQREKVQNISF